MLARSIDEIEENARLRREDRVFRLLERLVPEYRRGTPEPRAAASGGEKRDAPSCGIAADLEAVLSTHV